MCHRVVLLTGLMFTLAMGAHAAEQTTRPAQTQGVAEAMQPLQAVITGVEGFVEVRDNENAPWQEAKAGMNVGQGAEFRTGPKSAVRFVIPPDQTVTLDRLGTVKVLEAIRGGGKIKTDLGMKYGRVRYDIEAAGLEHDATIHSPGSTLAVRGTKVSLTNHAPFKPVATSLVGRARFKDLAGKTTAFGGKAKATIESSTGGAAFTALNRTYVDPTSPLGRTTSEQEAVLTQPTVAVFTTGGTGTLVSTPRVEPIVPRSTDILSGSLIFQLVWIGSGVGSVTPDLDLLVISPRGEPLFAKGGAAVVPSGGRSPQDDRGGSSGHLGQELVIWPTGFPAGTYQYRVQHVSGVEGEYQVAVIRNGQVIGELAGGSVDEQNSLASYAVQVLQNGGPDQEPATASKARVRREAMMGQKDIVKSKTVVRTERAKVAKSQRR